MASRLFNQFIGSGNANLTFIEGSFKVGVDGAVVPNSYTGFGVSASSTVTVQKMGTGVYRLMLADPYNRLVGATFDPMPALASSAIPDGQLPTLGIPYQIVNASTSTNWYTLGVTRNVTPLPGVVFVATSGASNTPGGAAVVGSGTMAMVGMVPFDSIELLPNINAQLSPTSATSGVGGASIYFQMTLASSASGAGGPRVRVNPTSGMWIRYGLFLRNSSLKNYNESSSTN